MGAAARLARQRAVGIGQEGGRYAQAKSGAESEMIASAKNGRGVEACLAQSNADSRVIRRAFADGATGEEELSPSCDRPDG